MIEQPFSETERRLADALQRLGRETRHREAPARVERRLVAAFRADAALTPRTRPGVWWTLAGWAAALAVTAGLAIFMVRTRQPEQTQPSRRPTQLAVELPLESDGLEQELPPEFIRLPNAEELALNEPVNLVRLELPRSAMIAMGLTVAAEQESVEADVMLGADGIARAVRFLD